MATVTTISKANLTALLGQIQTVVREDMCIEYTPDGWRIKAVDAAHVAMIDIMVWRQTAMDAYEPDPQIAEVFLPIKKLSDALSVFPDDQPVTLTDNGETTKLDCGKMHRMIRNVAAPDSPRPKIPELELNCIFDLETSEIARMMQKGLSVSDHFRMTCGPEGLRIVIASDEDEVAYEDPEKRSADGQLYSSMFPLDYFVSALNGLKGSIMVNMDTDYPVALNSQAPFTTKYLLAPRIEEQRRGRGT